MLGAELRKWCYHQKVTKMLGKFFYIFDGKRVDDPEAKHWAGEIVAIYEQAAIEVRPVCVCCLRRGREPHPITHTLLISLAQFVDEQPLLFKSEEALRSWFIEEFNIKGEQEKKPRLVQ